MVIYDCPPIKKEKRLQFKKMTRWERFLTWIMIPLMYVLQGALRESPQTTGLFSRRRFPKNVWQPDKTKTVKVTVAKTSRKKCWLGFIPKPEFCGERAYVVLKPSDNTRKWYAGRKFADGTVIVSAVPVYGEVRVLVRGTSCCHFGVTHVGSQVPLEQVGVGITRHGGPYAKLPLL